MLLATYIIPYANEVVVGDKTTLEEQLFKKAIDQKDYSEYLDKKIVIKGCGEIEVPANTYIYIMSKIQKYASSIMYGEPCSTVPLYKRPKK